MSLNLKARLRPLRVSVRSFIYHHIVNPLKGNSGNKMILEKYDSYEEYKEIQTQGNKKKLDVVWVSEKNIKFLSEYLKNNISNMVFGLCHGTRNGAEQKYFKKYLGIEMMGTEISDTATQFPDTIQWDFHEELPQYESKADFVYSNSFDHAYDPGKAFRAWTKTLKSPESVIVLEHSSGHGPEAATKLDPFGADLEAMPGLVKDWTNGDYEIVDTLRSPEIPLSLTDNHFLIIKKVT